MELKDYQKDVLSDLQHYLQLLKTKESLKVAFESFWIEKGVNVNVEKRNNYIHPYVDTIKGVPNVTVKVPTAGGKTFIACNSLKFLFEDYYKDEPRVIVWFVPSDEILRQTIRNLSNKEHPYRQRLDSIFNNNVQIIDKESALVGHGMSPVNIFEQVSLFILSVQSFATATFDLRSYKQNENLVEYSKLYNESTKRVEGADETSLIQVLSFLHPVIIVDESHNFTADLRVEVLTSLNPRFILNLTATPKESSNIISFVDAIRLKRANMVKLPVVVYNHKSTSDVIVNAINLQKSLEQRSIIEEQNGGKYIRPIVLFQAQPRVASDNITFEKIKSDLIELGVPEEQIRIKTSGNNQLVKDDLLSHDCQVRYIITVDALKEGWDCPFAYILASLANKTSRISVEQILGRILRLPYTTKHHDDLLNLSYVFTSSNDFNSTLNEIVNSLNKAGYSRKDFRIKEVQEIEVPENEPADFGFGGSLFGNNSNDESDSTSTNETGAPEYNIEDIKTSMSSPEASSAIKEMEDYARDQSDNYNEQTAKESNNSDLPSDIADMINQSEIKEDFEEDAALVAIPRFEIYVESDSFFTKGGTYVELDKQMLTEGFDLSKKDTSINFTLADSESAALDLYSSGKADEYEIVRRQLSSKQLSYIKEQFISMPKENKIRNAARNIAHRMKYDGVPEPQIVQYIQRAIQDLDNEKIDDILTRDVLYAQKVKDKIEALLFEHRKSTFEKNLDAGLIRCSPSYRFPFCINVTKKVPGLYKGLYQDEGDMNDFEARVIRQIAELDNVYYWHRNPISGFGINGYINHYPDFIVQMKNGMTVLVETKGDDRDNSDSMEKINLGSIWANKAGDKYRYYMVFDKKEVDGAVTVSTLLERLKNLR